MFFYIQKKPLYHISNCPEYIFFNKNKQNFAHESTHEQFQDNKLKKKNVLKMF